MKLSPLSVPYRVLERAGGIVGTALALLFADVSTASFPGFRLVVLFGAVAAGVLAIGYEVVRYRRYRVRLAAEGLSIRSGVVGLRQREIPYERIQTVDLSQNPVHRLLGIAVLNVETAGGSQSEASVRFLDVADARQLRQDLQVRTDETGDRAPEDLFALDGRELALAGLVSFDLRVPGLLLFFVTALAPVIRPFLPGHDGLAVALFGLSILAVGTLLFSWIAGMAITVSNFYGFRLGRVGDELVYERGLLRRHTGSIPLDKVQTLTIDENPLKRLAGYATLAIETAGYSPGQRGSHGSEAAVPLATRERVLSLAHEIDDFGEPAFERPPRRVRRRYAIRYLLVLGVVAALLYGVTAAIGGGDLPLWPVALVVPVVPVAAHLKWANRGYWLGPDHVVTRNGFWKRQTKVVPYYRIQTVIERRTVFQRRWGLATVVVDTAGSLSIVAHDSKAVDVDAATAVRLREELEERFTEALADRRATGFDWVDLGDAAVPAGADGDTRPSGGDGAGDANSGV